MNATLRPDRMRLSRRLTIRAASLAALLLMLALCLPQSSAAQPATYRCLRHHVVRPSETLTSIAEQYAVDPDRLAYDNGIRNQNLILIGQRLCIGPELAAPVTDMPPAAPTKPATAADMPDDYPAEPMVAPSAVVLWNEVMLAAIRNGGPRPTVTARNLYMVHQAMYDAWTAYDAVAQPVYTDPALRRPASERTTANKTTAVSQAAYQMLIQLYAPYETSSRAFSTLLRLQGYAPATERTDRASPAWIGFNAAQAVLKGRADDGSNAANKFADVTSTLYPELYAPRNSADPLTPNSAGQAEFDINHWQPLRVPTGTRTDANGVPIVVADDPTSFADQSFLTPHWGSVRPFAMASGDDFRPPPPPQAGSSAPYVDALGKQMTNDAAFQLQVTELLEINATLTDEQKVMAEYWADGPRSETPPGHWNALAHGISERDKLGIDDDVKLYFALNGALFDASISAWDAKRVYDFVRPVSAIRHLYADQTIRGWGGLGSGTIELPGSEWHPYQDMTFVTPGFPEYVSGHSTFSAAAAEVLTQFTGSNRFYDGHTILYYEDFNRDGVPDLLGEHIARIGGNKYEKGPTEIVALRWDTFQDAADQAALSRRYGGIHFQDGDLHGRTIGIAVGKQAFELAAALWRGNVTR